MEVVKFISQERVQQRTMEQIFDVPQVFEPIVIVPMHGLLEDRRVCG